MNKITSEETIKRLEPIFVRLGYPKSITLDNGRQFISKDFEDYCFTRNITLNHTSPYWPQANGEVERQNSSLLKRLKISHSLNRDWKVDLLQYMMMYNTTPHSVTGKAPTALLQNRVIRSKLPSITDLETMLPASTGVHDRDTVMKHKGKEREDLRRHARPSDIQVGDKVLLQNIISAGKLTATYDKTEYEVLERTGNRVKITDPVSGRITERNVAHVKKISTSEEIYPETEEHRAVEDQQPVSRSDPPRPSRCANRPSWHQDYVVHTTDDA